MPKKRADKLKPASVLMGVSVGEKKSWRGAGSSELFGDKGGVTNQAWTKRGGERFLDESGEQTKRAVKIAKDHSVPRLEDSRGEEA